MHRREHLGAPHQFSYTDDYNIEISTYVWLPSAAGAGADTDVIATSGGGDNPHGIVQLAHGVGEHALRYDAFARTLAANGFVVYANDHRGHGETGRRQHGGDLSQLGRLGPGGLYAAEAAILQLTQLARGRHPGLPLIMFAHSWGSLMVQRMLNREQHLCDAAVLSGSAYRTPRYLETGDLNRRWRGPEANGFEWLSRDPGIAAAFIADPLCFGADIAQLFGYLDGLKLFGIPARQIDDIPMLIVSGGDDPLSKGGQVRKLAEVYQARGVHDLTLRVFPGARHEVLNEVNRDEVIAEIITWMLDRFSADA